MGTQDQFTQEQLQHFIDHPDEVDATNTALVEALARAELPVLADTEAREQIRREAGVDSEYEDPDGDAAKKAVAEAEAKMAADKAAEDAAAATKAKADADAAAAAKATTGATVDGEGQRVATKDGKHTLPFSVLEDARNRATAAEAAAQEAHAALVTLSARVKALEAGQPDPGAGDGKTADELEQLLEKVGEDAPWAKEPIGKLIGAVRNLTERVESFESERQETEEEITSRLQRASDTALRANPELTLWKANAPALYEEAVAFDKTIRSNPAMAARYDTFDKRYARVVELVKTSHAGEEIPLPQPVKEVDPVTGTAADPSKKPAVQAPAKAASPSAEETTARAKEVLAKAAVAPVSSAVPFSQPSCASRHSRATSWAPPRSSPAEAKMKGQSSPDMPIVEVRAWRTTRATRSRSTSSTSSAASRSMGDRKIEGKGERSRTAPWT
jgi:hypothetical protein